ncbi:trehalose-phosphatase [Legionella lytica]|uniref:Trehalose 6-phosphate phosphatase n=1 Tax=Legionella lytica TaxID=96232 RepID=A0ABW8DC72_9GAMM
MNNIKGIIFDMDGVVTQTATLHFEAWKNTLDAFLLELNPTEDELFTENDYFYYLDGMPRNEGLSNFLTSRKITSDAHQEKWISHLADKKNDYFQTLLKKHPVNYFPDTLQFIEFLLLNQYQIALISSSKNCIPILKSAQIEHLFPIYVDGIISERLNIAGKPEPDIFLEAAKRLKLQPQECLVIEDALSGVKAAKKGQFGKVIALDRKQKLYSQFLELEPDYILPDLSKAPQLFNNDNSDNKQPISGLAVLPSIHQLMKHCYQFIIFLDYDGTLTPIVDRPEQAILSAAMHDCLSSLSQEYLTVIISGRALNDLKEHINISTLFYSGNHGLEFMGPRSYYQIGAAFKEEIEELDCCLSKKFNGISGCLIENKTFSLSVHYRLVDKENLDLIEKQIDAVLLNYPRLKKHYGKKVYEIRPNILWNKGIASNAILEKFKLNNPHLIPIYIGDDVSDEDAFEVFQTKGITIKVEQNPLDTKANYFLNSPLEVQRFLTQLSFLKEI